MDELSNFNAPRESHFCDPCDL